MFEVGLDVHEKYRCREMKETKETKEKKDQKESEKKDKIWDLVSDLNPY